MSCLQLTKIAKIFFYLFFNVLLNVLRDISVQYEPTGCTIYFQLISIINLYMFRARLTAHHQELLLCIYSSLYMSCFYVDWLLAFRSCQQPVNI